MSARRYAPELKAQALRLVDEAKSAGQRRGVIPRIADQLGINRDTLRNWVSCARPSGAGSPTIVVHVHVTGSVIAQRALERGIQQAVLRMGRRNPPGGLTNP